MVRRNPYIIVNPLYAWDTSEHHNGKGADTLMAIFWVIFYSRVVPWSPPGILGLEVPPGFFLAQNDPIWAMAWPLKFVPYFKFQT